MPSTPWPGSTTCLSWRMRPNLSGGRTKGKRPALWPMWPLPLSFRPNPWGAMGMEAPSLLMTMILAAILRSIRVHGQGSDKYDNIRIGLNGRLDTLQAAIVLAKMDIFDQEVVARQEVAERYSQGLQDVVEVPYVAPDCTSIWAQYSVLSDQRQVLQDRLKTAGIPTAVYYPLPLHLQGAFTHLGYQPGDFPSARRLPNAFSACRCIPDLEAAQQDVIIKSLQSV